MLSWKKKIIYFHGNNIKSKKNMNVYITVNGWGIFNTTSINLSSVIIPKFFSCWKIHQIQIVSFYLRDLGF
jgi:hypothetical protein